MLLCKFEKLKVKVNQFLYRSGVAQRVPGGFIITLTRAQHLSLSSARSIQSMHPHNLVKIHFNIILISKPVFYNWSLSFGFPHQNPTCSFLSPIGTTCPAHVILYLTNRIVSGVEHSSVSFSLFSFLHSPVISSLLGPNILLSTLRPQPTFLPQCEPPSFTPKENNAHF